VTGLDRHADFTDIMTSGCIQFSRSFLNFVNRILVKYIIDKMIRDLVKAISLFYTEGEV